MAVRDQTGAMTSISVATKWERPAPLVKDYSHAQMRSCVQLSLAMIVDSTLECQAILTVFTKVVLLI